VLVNHNTICLFLERCNFLTTADHHNTVFPPTVQGLASIPPYPHPFNKDWPPNDRSLVLLVVVSIITNSQLHPAFLPFSGLHRPVEGKTPLFPIYIRTKNYIDFHTSVLSGGRPRVGWKERERERAEDWNAENMRISSALRTGVARDASRLSVKY